MAMDAVIIRGLGMDRQGFGDKTGDKTGGKIGAGRDGRCWGRGCSRGCARFLDRFRARGCGHAVGQDHIGGDIGDQLAPQFIDHPGKALARHGIPGLVALCAGHPAQAAFGQRPDQRARRRAGQKPPRRLPRHRRNAQPGEKSHHRPERLGRHRPNPAPGGGGQDHGAAVHRGRHGGILVGKGKRTPDLMCPGTVFQGKYYGPKRLPPSCTESRIPDPPHARQGQAALARRGGFGPC